MDSTIIEVIVSVLSYLAARGLDSYVGKWLAYFTIAWEKAASKQAMDSYTETKNLLVKDMADKSKEWDNWRSSIQR